VTVAVPASIQSIVAGYEPSYLTRALEDTPLGQLSLAAGAELLSTFAAMDAGAIGPGLGQSADLEELVFVLYRQVMKPLVIDADGLNALARRHGDWSRGPAAGPRVLTPHPGEFARLCGSPVPDGRPDRESLAATFAHQHGVVLVLKGAGTIITDGRRLAVNPTGNAGLATGGTGDVLTGLLAGLLGQGLEPFEAARLAVSLHGLAGDLAAEQLSQPGLIASDLPRFLALAWKHLGG
jgi:NAD(P)H-hydrate epimerase